MEQQKTRHPELRKTEHEQATYSGGTVPVTDTDDKKPLYRETGSSMNPKDCEHCSGAVNGGTSISVASKRNRIVIDMFAMRHTCFVSTD
ncbi:MAG: hypothetical protein EG824_11050 [Deltaproteobacteria bacterium]|nr:hypothetical protein [Deltaproteobacteria bacterium]